MSRGRARSLEGGNFSLERVSVQCRSYRLKEDAAEQGLLQNGSDPRRIGMIHEALGALIHHEHSRQAKTRQDATSPSPQSGEHLLVEQKASSERAVSRRIEGPLRMSFGATMMLGMVGCEVCIHTCKAVAVIPVVSATCLKRGA